MSRKYNRKANLIHAYKTGRRDAIEQFVQDKEVWANLLRENVLFREEMVRVKPRFLPRKLWRIFVNFLFGL